MLVLARKVGEKIIIGNAIQLTVLAVSGNQVKVGIEAPKLVRILRAELGCERLGPMGCDSHLHTVLEPTPQPLRQT
jgi:carbon storage regulator CsrA